ncbi:winged helix-turn-helix domain-containing protein [Algibacter sp.]|nr:winged helix-turn-helix domain-containing protein [Algibacter sp.]MDC1277047.1 winged helix-turn-helix domain-containing protein [Algibacter sp.]
MSSRYFKIVSSIFICLILFINRGSAQDISSDKHIEVALRMIGHEILLSNGDSTSRVLPVIKEGFQYRIQFESDLVFDPDYLVSTVNSIVKETGITNNYIVEMVNCETTEVVYSFEMNYLAKSDIIPCKGRVQPRSCYNLLFTILEPEAMNTESSLEIYLIMGLVLLIFCVIFFLWKKSNTQKNNPNLIPLGAYHFDKQNTELIIDHQKIELTTKEADLLLLLYNAANTTVERDVILNMVWGDEGDYIGRTVDVFISKLRKKLEFDSKVKIVNVRGVGYKLIMDV